MGDSEAFGKLELELRRGVVVLATLSQLRAPRYGYELRQALADRGMPIEEGPPRRYYSLNADGRKLLKKLVESWQGLNGAMDRLLEEDGQ